LKIIKLTLLLVIVLIAAPAPAEIYKYEDELGNVYYTDDINQVPEDQRDSFEVSIEYVSDTQAEEANTDSELKSSYDDVLQAMQGSEDDNDDNENVAHTDGGGLLDESNDGEIKLDADRKSLAALKKEIDKEYAALVKEKEKLAKDQKELATKEDVLKFNAKVEGLNKRTEAYVQKGKQYKKQVEAYNEHVIQRNTELSRKKE
jgi:hypothetical protein